MNGLEIYLDGNGTPIAKFEKWEGNKAMDWITAKGYYIIHKETFPYHYWVVKKLP